MADNDEMSDDISSGDAPATLDEPRRGTIGGCCCDARRLLAGVRTAEGVVAIVVPAAGAADGSMCKSDWTAGGSKSDPARRRGEHRAAAARREGELNVQGVQGALQSRRLLSMPSMSRRRCCCSRGKKKLDSAGHGDVHEYRWRRRTGGECDSGGGGNDKTEENRSQRSAHRRLLVSVMALLLLLSS